MEMKWEDQAVDFQVAVSREAVEIAAAFPEHRIWEALPEEWADFQICRSG